MPDQLRLRRWPERFGLPNMANGHGCRGGSDAVQRQSMPRQDDEIPVADCLAVVALFAQAAALIDTIF